MSHCVRNSSLTIIWNNLGLSNYKHLKNKLGLKTNKQKHTCYNFKKELFSPLFKRESSYSYAFVTSLNHSIVPGRIFCWTFIEICFLKYVFFSKFKIPFHTFDKTDPNYSKWYSVMNSWNRVTRKHFWNLIAVFFLLNLHAKNTYVSKKLL